MHQWHVIVEDKHCYAPQVTLLLAYLLQDCHLNNCGLSSGIVLDALLCIHSSISIFCLQYGLHACIQYEA